MEMAQHIIEEAKRLLQSGRNVFPVQITSAPEFFLAPEEDGSILAFGALHHDGKVYKLGVKKHQ